MKHKVSYNDKDGVYHEKLVDSWEEGEDLMEQLSWEGCYLMGCQPNTDEHGEG